MFTDISVSTDLNNKFNAHLKDKNVEIGKSGSNISWPSLFKFSQSNRRFAFQE